MSYLLGFYVGWVIGEYLLYKRVNIDLMWFIILCALSYYIELSLGIIQ